MNVSIIMCTWKRIERLQKTIDMLSAQTYKDFTFCIWNNNHEIRSEIDAIVNTANIKIEVHHNETNIGGIGRFYFASQKNGIIIFIDDDEEFDDKLVEYFVGIYKPKHIFSWHAWRIKGGYWDRERVYSGDCDYAGTCGMVSDSEVFKDKNLFYELPEKYLFVEDLWLSYFAKYRHGYKIQGCTPNIWAINDKKNQCTNMFKLKDQFLTYLKQKFLR